MPGVALSPASTVVISSTTQLPNARAAEEPRQFLGEEPGRVGAHEHGDSVKIGGRRLPILPDDEGGEGTARARMSSTKSRPRICPWLDVTAKASIGTASRSQRERA
jgi:hypothetical protein